jgi:mannose-6-phosphate isomerase-like protein (cupin superfamily)
MIEKVTLSQKFRLFDEHWSPKIVGQINNFHVKLVKLLGEFVWHHHDEEDELFLVVQGRLRINLRDQAAIELEPGEFVIIPRGVEHQPVADEECQVVLFEAATTLNTGNVRSERTVDHSESI